MKTNMRHPLFLITLLLFFLSFGNASIAAAETLAAPQLGIQEASEKLRLKIQQDKSFIQDFPQVNEFVHQNIYPYVDFNRMSALVLGQNWKQASSDDRVRFTKEFQTLLIRTYSRAFVEFKDWSVRYLPLNMESGATKVIVNTEVLQPGIQPIGVSYRMVLVDGVWKAYDIMIEGVSLVTNYRSSFNTEIARTGSLTSVIDDLSKRNSGALATKG
ncbi:MAG: ABC transporter substrate-binding protein [Methylococcales bacterium]|nr:ABC transporter substrate-binding protein [Methylococcales bacterium]